VEPGFRKISVFQNFLPGASASLSKRQNLSRTSFFGPVFWRTTVQPALRHGDCDGADQPAATRGIHPLAVLVAQKIYAHLDLSAVSQAENADTSLLKSLPLARELKQRIKDERHLTATIGIAANKLLAKIASDHQKPDGLTLVSEKDKVQFLRPLPVRALFGVGKVTEEVLNKAGVRTVGDLQDYPGDLRALVGSFASRLKQFASQPSKPNSSVGRSFPHGSTQPRRRGFSVLNRTRFRYS
jgi:hypothetical protein